MDIHVPGFWIRQQPAYIDIRVTHSEARLMSVREARKHLERHEREKKRQYCERVNVIDRGTFRPLVFSTSGMAGQECGRLLKAIAADVELRPALLACVESAEVQDLFLPAQVKYHVLSRMSNILQEEVQWIFHRVSSNSFSIIGHD